MFTKLKLVCFRGRHNYDSTFLNSGHPTDSFILFEGFCYMRNQFFCLIATFCMSHNAFAEWKRSTSENDSTITPFRNCNELKEYIVEEIIAGKQKVKVGEGRSLGLAGSGGSVNNFGSGSSGGFGGAEGDTSGPSNVTKTNNQTVGVEEADSVKTNGRYLFKVVDGFIHVIKIWPAKELREVFRIKVDTEVHSIILEANRLFVFLKHNEIAGNVEMLSQINIGSIENRKPENTRLMIYDVTKPEVPKLIRTEDFLGSYSDARMIDGKIALLLKNYVRHIDTGLKDEDGSKDKSVFKTSFKSVDINNLLGTRGLKDINCQRYFRSKSASDLNLTKLIKFDPVSASSTESNLFSSYSKHYISSNAAYLFEHKYDGVDNNVYRLPLDSQKAPTKGSFEGTLINSFAADEYKDFLRIAVTSINRGNFVLVFKQSEKELVQIGRSPELAPSETIRSVRYAGDTAYVVTFKMIDPLFILDLSTPKTPKVLGELKVPGYSTYIHPIKKDRLLTVGISTDPNSGLELGVKISR